MSGRVVGTRSRVLGFLRSQALWVSLIGTLVCVNLAYYAANFIRFGDIWIDGYSYPSLYIIIHLVAIGAFFLADAHRIRSWMRFPDVLRVVIGYMLVMVFLITTYWVVFKSYQYSRIHLALFFAGTGMLCLLWAWAQVLFMRRVRLQGDFHRTCAILGHGRHEDELARSIHANPWLGHDLVGSISFTSPDATWTIDGIDALDDLLVRENIDLVFLSLRHVAGDEDLEQRLRDISENTLTEFRLFGPLVDQAIARNGTEYIGDTAVVPLFERPLDNDVNRFVKRLADVVIALLVTVLILSWVIPLLGLLILIDSPRGGIFFVQERSGRYNRPFGCIKFRTMRVNTQADRKQATRSDDRITRVGRILRRTSLDELPQFLNVLVGDMSVVGPRPHMVRHTEQYSAALDKFLSRHAIKPGITGLAQVKGYRGGTEEPYRMEGRLKLDRFYMRNWSLMLDLRIIWLTVWTVLRGDENAY